MRTCPKCGTNLKDEHKLCMKCGASLADEPVKTPETVEPSTLLLGVKDRASAWRYARELDLTLSGFAP